VRSLLWLAAGSTLLWGLESPATANRTADSNVEQSDASSTPDDFGTLFRDAMGPKPGQVVGRIDRLLNDPHYRDMSALLMALRGAALLSDGRIEDAEASFDKSHEIDPSLDVGDRMRFIVGLYKDAPAQSSIALDHMIARAPDAAREIERDLLFSYLRENKVTPKAHLDDQRIALAELGYGGNQGDDLARAAARLLLERGEKSRAEAVIEAIDSPEVIQQMLTSRTYEALWPDIERRANGSLNGIASEQLRQARVDFDADPKDMRKRAALISALASLHQFDEANRIGAEVGRTPAELAQLDEEGAWVIDAQAEALHLARKLTEADDRLASLNAAAKDQPYIVNMVINRLEHLVRDGNFAAADPLIAQATAVARDQGSPYARQLVRRLAICTSVGLGRLQSIESLTNELIQHEADARTATVEGLLCAGKDEQAAKVALTMLADPDDRDDALNGLERSPTELSDPSIWIGYWERLRSRPEVDRAFNSAGRDLPPQYIIH
jgi:hypothetical protein